MRGLRALIYIIWLCGLCIVQTSAQACTTSSLLVLIGQLEAPEGFNQTYSGVKFPPPEPLEQMTVQEVMDWQSVAGRAAVSSAAGRYQLTREVLDALVQSGVIRARDRFNPKTQTRAAIHLLEKAGYKDGVSDPDVANRIATLWPSFPRVSATNSADENAESTTVPKRIGIAGNPALLDDQSFMQFLKCEIDIHAAKSASSTIQKSRSLSGFIENLLEQTRQASERIAKNLTPMALPLLFAMFTIQLVLTGAQTALRGTSLSEFLTAFTFKLLIFVLLWAVILKYPEFLKMVQRAAGALSGTALGQSDFSLQDYVVGRSNLLTKNMMIASTLGVGPELVAAGVAALSYLLMMAIVAVIIWHYAAAFLTAAMASFVLAFGALEALKPTAINAVSTLTIGLLRIFAVNGVFFILWGLFKSVIDQSASQSAAFGMLVMDVLMLVLLAVLPTYIARLGKLR